jgi:hypothetical protein
MSRSLPVYPRRTRRRTIVLGGILVVGLLGVGLVLVSAEHHGPARAAPATTPTVDPRLIIRPRHAPVAAVLSHGVRLTGTLYPAYPGRNTLRLAVQGRSGAPAPGNRVALVASMPGMAMAPIRATLVARDHHYVGILTLPMFGTYPAQVVVDTPTGRATGSLTLALSLPRL